MHQILGAAGGLCLRSVLLNIPQHISAALLVSRWTSSRGSWICARKFSKARPVKNFGPVGRLPCTCRSLFGALRQFATQGFVDIRAGFGTRLSSLLELRRVGIGASQVDACYSYSKTWGPGLVALSQTEQIGRTWASRGLQLEARADDTSALGGSFAAACSLSVVEGLKPWLRILCAEAPGRGNSGGGFY